MPPESDQADSSDSPDEGPRETHVTPARSDTISSAVVFGLVGALLGWFLPWIAGFAADADWFPFQGPLRLADRVFDDHGWVRWVLLAALPVLGVVAGVFLVAASTTVRVTAAEIELIKDDTKRRWARAQVSRVLIEGKELVLRDHQDGDLVREKLDVDVDAVAAAVSEHGWDVERR